MWWRKKGGQPKSSWREEVARLAQEAQAHAANGDVEQASQLVSAAFEIVDDDGSEEDVVFSALLLVAADLSLDCGEFESAASLYKRASEIALTLAAPSEPAGDVVPLLARAFLGLARADVGRGYGERAQQRYQKALQYLNSSKPEPPEQLIEEVRAELRALA